MAIAKGYLRPRVVINPQWILVGFTIGTIFSYVFYKIFYYFREIYRILIYHLADGLMELTPKEHFTYNIFYGSISATLGLYFAIIFILENSLYENRKKTRIGQRAIINDQRFFLWNFLNGFFRFVWLIGFLFITLPLQYEVEFIKDFVVHLILVPIVLFLALWPNFLRIFGKKGYKWIGFSFLYVLVLTFIYGNISFSNIEKTNANLTKSDVIRAYNIKLPVTKSYTELFTSFWASNLFFVKDSSSSDPIIYVESLYDHIKYHDLPLFVAKEKDKYPENRRDAFSINLFIDENMPLHDVNQLKLELRKIYVDKVQFSTNIFNSKFPPNAPQQKYLGIYVPLEPIYSRKMIQFLDSAEKLDPKKHVLKLPQSGLYRIHDIVNHKFVRLNVKKDEVLLNGSLINDEDLKEFLYKFIKTHSPNYNIIFDPEEEISFGRYIHYLDIIYSTIDQLHNELSIKHYKKPYEINIEEFFSPDSIFEIVELTFPNNVIELSEEEKRLFQLVKKMGYVRD